MTNEVYGLIGIVVGVVAFMAWYAFASIRGVSGSLSTAKVGQVYSFEYEQPHLGEPKRVLAKIIQPVYELSDAHIKALNRKSYYRRNDPEFKRTKHLVTCKMPNGDVRQFYTERTKNVRRCLSNNLTLRRAIAAML